MKLKELFGIISIYQDIQLMDSQTGEILTDVTYISGGSRGNIESIESHESDLVHGITAKIAEDETPYLLVTITQVC